MLSPARDGASQSTADLVPQITAFMRRCTFEATRPSAKDVAALREHLAPGSIVYLTMLPGQAVDETVAAAVAIREAGLEPAPHLAARHFLDMRAVDALLGQFSRRAQVRRVLLIGGDVKTPNGSVPDVLSVIESGVLQQNQISEVGVGGFPDGHPAVDEDDLEIALLAKLAALQRGGLDAHIVTQFAFDAKPILRWLEWLRGRGVHAPVHVGLAGPTSLMAWLNYARKCGVKASAEALATRSGLVRQAFRSVAPDPIVRELAAALSTLDLGSVSPHLFAFGGIGATAKWAQPAIRGEIRLNRYGGYDPV